MVNEHERTSFPMPGELGDGSKPPRRRPRLALIIVAAAVTIAVGVTVGLGAAGWLRLPASTTGAKTPDPTVIAPSGSPVASVTSPSPTESPTATLEATQTPPATWQTGVIESTDPGGIGPYYFGVRWFPDIGWLAFGQGKSADLGEGPPALWHSDDGIAWRPAVIPSGLDGFGIRDVEVAVFSEGPRLVAVMHDFRNSRVLLSTDGQTWGLADAPDAAANISAVAFGDGGFVAIGTNRDYAGPDSVDGVVWRSPDGEAWNEIIPAELTGAVPVVLERISGHGYVAVGRLDGEAPPRTLTWTSLDGMSWQEHEIRPAQDGGGSIGIISDSDGSLVVTAGEDPGAYVGLSDDAALWSFEPLPSPQVGPTAIDISPEAIVVAGFHFVADGPSDSYVWVRDRGDANWRSVDWRGQLADAQALEFGAAIGVAVGPAHTLILFGNGRVLLTNGPLP